MLWATSKFYIQVMMTNCMNGICNTFILPFENGQTNVWLCCSENRAHQHATFFCCFFVFGKGYFKKDITNL